MRADRLSDGWRWWGRESEALQCSTPAAVALRVRALDEAIGYCKVTKASRARLAEAKDP